MVGLPWAGGTWKFVPGLSRVPLHVPLFFADFNWYPFHVINHSQEYNSLSELWETECIIHPNSSPQPPAPSFEIFDILVTKWCVLAHLLFPVSVLWTEGSRRQKSRVGGGQVPALPLSGSVALGEQHHLSIPVSSFVKQTREHVFLFPSSSRDDGWAGLFMPRKASTSISVYNKRRSLCLPNS